MASPIFNAMNSQQQAPNGQMDVVRQFNSFRQDPFAFMLQRKGIKIPQEYQNDPEGAVRYLLNNGQMTQDQLNFLKGIARKMNIPLN